MSFSLAKSENNKNTYCFQGVTYVKKETYAEF